MAELLQYFDSHVAVGKSAYKHRLQMWQTESVIAEMQRAGIANALIYHGMAKSHSPTYGNGLLAEELQKGVEHGVGLFGCYVALPDQAGDFVLPEVLVDSLRANNIRAVKIFPRTHQFDLDQRTAGALLKVLEREQIPVLVDGGEAGIGELAWMMQYCPDLKVLLQGFSWSQERRLFPLMDECAGLHVDFSSLQSNAIIETMVARYGPERLVFGSGMPAKSPGAARALVDYAQISDEAKRLIAGGNLARLLGMDAGEAAGMNAGATPKLAVAKAPDQDEIVIQASQGLPITAVTVLDSHTHLIEQGGATGSGYPMLHGDIDAMVALYQRIGIRKMSIAAWAGINGGDSEAGNQITELARLKYPQVVEGYVVIDPNYVEDVIGEARKWHLDKGFKGMKPYYFLSHLPYTDPVYAEWWELGNKHKLYALVDPGLLDDGAYVAMIEELARRYPDVAIFMDHAARSWEVAALYVNTARKFGNVYLQLTYTTVTLGAIEYLVKEVGAHKVLFGTDSPMRDPRPQVGWLAYANLTLEQKRAVFGGNMQRLWERCLV